MDNEEKRGLRRFLAYLTLIISFSIGAYRIGYMVGHQQGHHDATEYLEQQLRKKQQPLTPVKSIKQQLFS
jgi:hypothetical protein